MGQRSQQRNADVKNGLPRMTHAVKLEELDAELP